jgi:hypothetical protein
MLRDTGDYNHMYVDRPYLRDIIPATTTTTTTTAAPTAAPPTPQPAGFTPVLLVGAVKTVAAVAGSMGCVFIVTSLAVTAGMYIIFRYGLTQSMQHVRAPHTEWKVCTRSLY